MVDEKKVRTMIELARYEEGEGREDLRIRRFYRGDFLTVQLIKNWFLTTISYILLLALLVGGNLEFLMNNLDSMDIPVVLSLILIGYVALIGLYLAITYISSAVRYGRARKRLREYVVKLRSLYRMK